MYYGNLTFLGPRSAIVTADNNPLKSREWSDRLQAVVCGAIPTGNGLGDQIHVCGRFRLGP
jgi:hypothetical protein